MTNVSDVSCESDVHDICEVTWMNHSDCQEGASLVGMVDMY